jgi:hypothetical protein
MTLGHAATRASAVSKVRYHRNDTTIEVVHVVGYMGENYVETRCREPGEDAQGDWNLWSLTGSPIHRFTCIRTDPATAQTDLTRKMHLSGARGSSQADPSSGALVGHCHDRNRSFDLSPSLAALVRT